MFLNRVVDRSSPPFSCPPTKGVISMPLWLHAVGAITTVQTIAANRRFVFTFVHSSAPLFRAQTVARSAIPRNCKLLQTHSLNPLRVNVNRGELPLDRLTWLDRAIQSEIDRRLNLPNGRFLRESLSTRSILHCSTELGRSALFSTVIGGASKTGKVCLASGCFASL